MEAVFSADPFIAEQSKVGNDAFSGRKAWPGFFFDRLYVIIIKYIQFHSCGFYGELGVRPVSVRPQLKACLRAAELRYGKGFYQMDFRCGTHSDIAELTQMRVEYLTVDWGCLTEQQEQAVRAQVPGCLEQHLGKSLTAYVAEEDGRMAGTVLMLQTEKPAGPAYLNGKTGTLLNVYVRPEYRDRGLGAHLVNMALEDARARGLCHVELEATAQGKRLYEHLGFQKAESHYTPMVFQL